MSFLNKYVKAVEDYYGKPMIYTPQDGKGRNARIDLEMVRMLILLLNEEEGLKYSEIALLLPFKKKRLALRNDSIIASDLYRLDRFFRKRYSEILQTIPKIIIE